MRNVTLCHEHGIGIAAAARTPFGRFGGRLASFGTADLGTAAIDRVLQDRSDPVDAAYIGVGMIAAGVLTPVRRMVLESRLDDQTPSLTVDRACCSGMTAIGLSIRDMLSGNAGRILCGGAESLSNTPRLMPRGRSARPSTVVLDDPLLLRAPFGDTAIATYSGQEAVKYGVSREAQDAWAQQSHERYFAAEDQGLFGDERFSLETPDGPLAVDEGPRRDSSLEKLATLATVYDSPTVTPGNAPGLSDGAAMMVLSRVGPGAPAGSNPVVRILGYSQVAGARTSGTSTPAVAIQTLLSALGLDVDRLDAIEINEAYAATPLVSTLFLADHDGRRAEDLRQRTNCHGGAVAIGHPLGASGARIVMSLITVLKRRGGGLGAAAICGGYGQGDAIVLRVE